MMVAVRGYALHHQSNVPLWNHLYEVNREWASQPVLDRAAVADIVARTCSFATDRERIQAHLCLATAVLAQRSTAHLAPRQRTRRAELLGVLRAYTEKGIFPTNHYHLHRQPYFIDNFGVPCAVGHLMIASGKGDLAKTVHRTMNNAYIREIPYPELAQWANEHGFEVAELALIQPGYPATLSAFPLGGGTNGTIRAMVSTPAIGSGNLIVAGDFTEADGVACAGVARWDGAQFLPFGTLEGTTNALCIYNGSLYAGGLYAPQQGNGGNIAKWNGSAWEYSEVHTGEVFALHVHKDTLYAGGEFNTFVPANIGRFDGTYWSNLGWGLNGGVRALTSYKGDLVAGGDFTGTGAPIMPPATLLNHVARWNGTEWQAVAGGLDNRVRALLAVGDTLYAGGDFAAQDSTPTFGFATTTGATWQAHVAEFNGDGIGDGRGNFDGYVSSLSAVSENGLFRVYIGGKFNIMPMMGTYGSHLAKYIPEYKYCEAAAILDSTVNAVRLWEGKMFVGGAYNNLIGGSPAMKHIFYVNDVFATRVDAPSGFPITVRVFPNPAQQEAYIALPDSIMAQGLDIALLNVQGQSLSVPTTIQQDGIHLDISRLAKGAYYLRVATREGAVVGSASICRE